MSENHSNLHTLVSSGQHRAKVSKYPSASRSLTEQMETVGAMRITPSASSCSSVTAGSAELVNQLRRASTITDFRLFLHFTHASVIEQIFFMRLTQLLTIGVGQQKIDTRGGQQIYIQNSRFFHNFLSFKG